MPAGSGMAGLSELEAELVMAVGEGKRVLQIGGPDPLTEALSARGCRVTVADAGEPGDRYEVVLVAEGLDGADDPAGLLRAARARLGPGGVVVAPVRNVAHGSLRLALLAGGVPDGGLRGRTRDGAARLFAEAGLEVVRWRSVEADPLEGLAPPDGTRFPEALVDALRRDPDAAALHYVVAATPAPGEVVGAPGRDEPPVLGVLAEMDEARRRLEAVGPRSLAIAKRLGRLFARTFPQGSIRRSLALGALRTARGLVRRRRRPPVERPRAGVDRAELERELRDFLAAPGRRLEVPRAEDPVVSIVVVTYNHAEHTLRCLRAIADHGDVPLEVILVDNASADATGELLDRLDGVTCIRNAENRHFLRGTNQGAEHATGRYLLLLNNDAYLEPGALRALVETAESADDVGAVGAKLVWPDGRLQEAGSILWRNGGALGYGRGGDPEASEYRYRREVDYCSAACLLVRRHLFEGLGGFDRRYEPAYFEDADLCMEVWSRGYRVLYEPRAAVVHNEYTSSDPARAQALMRTNHGRFEEKWRRDLASRPSPDEEAAVLRARDRRAGPAILVIDDRVPSPSYGAGLPRMSALIGFLADAGYRVTYAPMYFSELPQPETRSFEASGIEILERPRTGVDVADVRAILTERRGLYEKVLVSRPHSAVLVVPIVRELAPTAEIVYDAEALFYRREQAQAGGRETKEVRRTREVEARLIDAADKVVGVAEGEARLMRGLARNDAVFVWGHAVEARATERPFGLRSDLLFVGTFGKGWVSPNEGGVREFVERVLPLVVEEVPDVRLRIVGRNATEAVADLAGPCVRVEGFVEDLDAVYEGCRVFVNPVREAAGIPLKLTEAMGRGVPAVTSEVGTRSLGLSDGEEALSAASDEAFAEGVVRLYTDEELWTRIRDAEIRWVEEHCAPDRLRDELLRILEAPPRSGSAARVRSRDADVFGLCRTRLPRRIFRRPL